jgi:hypothetical protein
MKCGMRIYVSNMITTYQGNETIILDLTDNIFRYTVYSGDFSIHIKTSKIRRFIKTCKRIRKEYGC